MYIKVLYTYSYVAPDLVPSQWYVWTGAVVASARVTMAFVALYVHDARGMCAEHVLGVSSG